MQFPAGFLIPIHSPEAISFCLKKMAYEQNIWMTMRQAAIQLASDKLSWNNYGERAIQHYRNLITKAK